MANRFKTMRWSVGRRVPLQSAYLVKGVFRMSNRDPVSGGLRITGRNRPLKQDSLSWESRRRSECQHSTVWKVGSGESCFPQASLSLHLQQQQRQQQLMPSHPATYRVGIRPAAPTGRHSPLGTPGASHSRLLSRPAFSSQFSKTEELRKKKNRKGPKLRKEWKKER